MHFCIVRGMISCVVIDDDPDIVDLFCEMLELSRIEVLAIGYDGEEAVKLFDQFHPDVLFTDLSMPKYDGIRAIKEIRNQYPDAKIIVLTGDSGNSHSYLLDELQVDFILHKPFDMHAIKESITVTLLEKNIEQKS